MMPRTRLGEVLFGLLFLAIALAILAGVLWTSFTYLYPPRSVRNTEAGWAAAVPPEPFDERYIRVRAAAVERLKSYIAEMEADAATAALKQRAA